MSFQFDLDLIVAATVGLLVGILIGRAIWGRALKAHEALSMQLARLQAERDDERAAQARELAQARDAVRPLSDEVDRLRREAAQRKAVPAAAATEPAPTRDYALTDLKGVGDKLAARLAEIGVPTVAALAALSPEEARIADSKLDTFRGRIERDQLVEQARLLAAGRTTEYEARFGRIGG
jgi:predicted flap endonuclease-1-like 5' DNA nuclease